MTLCSLNIDIQYRPTNVYRTDYREMANLFLQKYIMKVKKRKNIIEDFSLTIIGNNRLKQKIQSTNNNKSTKFSTN